MKKTEERPLGFELSFLEEWSWMKTRRCSWYDFTLLNVRFERDYFYNNDIELEAMILGVGFRLRYSMKYEGSYAEKLNNQKHEQRKREGRLTNLDRLLASPKRTKKTKSGRGKNSKKASPRKRKGSVPKAKTPKSSR